MATVRLIARIPRVRLRVSIALVRVLSNIIPMRCTQALANIAVGWVSKHIEVEAIEAHTQPLDK